MRNSAVVSSIIGVLIVALVVFGRMAFTDDPQPEKPSSADRIPDLPDVLPISAQDYRAAAEAALLHSDAYGTFAPGEEADDYTERVRSAAPLADMPEGPVLGSAAACFELLADEDRAAEGSAEIRGISYLGADSAHFTMALSAVPKDGGTAIDLGMHEVLMILEDGEEWAVASSAEAGDAGTVPESGASP